MPSNAPPSRAETHWLAALTGRAATMRPGTMRAGGRCCCVRLVATPCNPPYPLPGGFRPDADFVVLRIVLIVGYNRIGEMRTLGRLEFDVKFVAYTP